MDRRIVIETPLMMKRRTVLAGAAASTLPLALPAFAQKGKDSMVLAMRDRLTALGAPCPVSRVVADPAALIDFGDERGWPVMRSRT